MGWVNSIRFYVRVDFMYPSVLCTRHLRGSPVQKCSLFVIFANFGLIFTWEVGWVNSKRFAVPVEFMYPSILCTRHMLLGLRPSLDPLRGSPDPQRPKKSSLFVILANFGLIFTCEVGWVNSKRFDVPVGFMYPSVLCTRHLLLGLRPSFDPLRGSPDP